MHNEEKWPNILLKFFKCAWPFFVIMHKRVKRFWEKATITRTIWGKLFKNGSSKIYWRQPLKNLKWCGQPKQTPCHLRFFKGCLPQTLLGLFLNTLTHLCLPIINRNDSMSKVRRWRTLHSYGPTCTDLYFRNNNKWNHLTKWTVAHFDFQRFV